MPKPCIHFICHDNLHVHKVPGSATTWTSGNWRITKEEAESLRDGMLYLHKKKTIVANHGGQIRSYRVREKTEEDPGTIEFTYDFHPAGKTRPWSKKGRRDMRAWTSGVVEDVE